MRINGWAGLTQAKTQLRTGSGVTCSSLVSFPLYCSSLEFLLPHRLTLFKTVVFKEEIPDTIIEPGTEQAHIVHEKTSGTLDNL